MSLLSIAVAFAVLFVISFAWFFLYYIGNPVLENPDGIAKIVGNYGDTMEIALNFEKGRVAATHYWTNGCSFSKHCVEAAAKLAYGKTFEELQQINMITIMEVTGQLPDTHLHCAQLAETTLYQSVENYLKKR
jgi:nitrogen fixation NifU-like protein